MPRSPYPGLSHVYGCYSEKINFFWVKFDLFINSFWHVGFSFESNLNVKSTHCLMLDFFSNIHIFILILIVTCRILSFILIPFWLTIARFSHSNLIALEFFSSRQQKMPLCVKIWRHIHSLYSKFLETNQVKTAKSRRTKERLILVLLLLYINAHLLHYSIQVRRKYY